MKIKYEKLKNLDNNYFHGNLYTDENHKQWAPWLNWKQELWNEGRYDKLTAVTNNQKSWGKEKLVTRI